MNELTRQRQARDVYKGSRDEKVPERFLLTIVTVWKIFITENILMEKICSRQISYKD